MKPLKMSAAEKFNQLKRASVWKKINDSFVFSFSHAHAFCPLCKKRPCDFKDKKQKKWLRFNEQTSVKNKQATSWKE